MLCITSFFTVGVDDSCTVSSLLRPANMTSSEEEFQQGREALSKRVQGRVFEKPTGASTLARPGNREVIQRLELLRAKQDALRKALDQLKQERELPLTDLGLLQRAEHQVSLRASTSQIKSPAVVDTSAEFVHVPSPGLLTARQSAEGLFSSLQDAEKLSTEDEVIPSATNGGHTNTLEETMTSEGQTSCEDFSLVGDDADSSILSWTDTSTDSDAAVSQSGISDSSVLMRPHALLLKSKMLEHRAGGNAPQPHLLHAAIPLLGHPARRAPVQLLHFYQDINVDGVVARGAHRLLPQDTTSQATQTTVLEELKKEDLPEKGECVATVEMECQTDAVTLPRPVEETAPVEPEVAEGIEPYAGTHVEPMISSASTAIMLPPAILLTIGTNLEEGEAIIFDKEKSYFDRHFLNVTDLSVEDLPQSVIDPFVCAGQMQPIETDQVAPLSISNQPNIGTLGGDLPRARSPRPTSQSPSYSTRAGLGTDTLYVDAYVADIDMADLPDRTERNRESLSRMDGEQQAIKEEIEEAWSLLEELEAHIA